ncbi:MAG: ATP-binding protein [Acidobacteriia bacterium]|nr:ATP-binding protein [Terriglobia bacterium]
MAVKPSVVEVTLESTLTNVEVAEEIARRVSATAGFDEEDQHKIEMAVHESMINAVWHGNKNDASKSVWLRFQIYGDKLEIRVRDQGSGFDPKSIPDPLEEANLLNVSGRGIFLIRTFMDDFRVEYVAGLGTEVTLVKNLNYRGETKQGGTGREHESHSSTN